MGGSVGWVESSDFLRRERGMAFSFESNDLSWLDAQCGNCAKHESGACGLFGRLHFVGKTTGTINVRGGDVGLRIKE